MDVHKSLSVQILDSLRWLWGLACSMSKDLVNVSAGAQNHQQQRDHRLLVANEVLRQVVFRNFVMQFLVGSFFVLQTVRFGVLSQENGQSQIRAGFMVMSGSLFGSFDETVRVLFGVFAGIISKHPSTRTNLWLQKFWPWHLVTRQHKP